MSITTFSPPAGGRESASSRCCCRLLSSGAAVRCNGPVTSGTAFAVICIRVLSLRRRPTSTRGDLMVVGFAAAKVATLRWSTPTGFSGSLHTNDCVTYERWLPVSRRSRHCCLLHWWQAMLKTWAVADCMSTDSDGARRPESPQDEVLKQLEVWAAELTSGNLSGHKLPL